MIPAMDSALSALDAFGKKMDVTANNIANVNTDGFKKSRADLQEADHGVTVNISRVNTPGAPIPAEDGTGKMKESSNVDVAEEIVNLKTTDNAFQANLKTIQAEGDMLGSLFDIFA
jgi:flagellar basal-body rod protein FlgC